MDNRSQQNIRSGKRWTAGFDRAAGELNVVLLAIAIGLATLDLTCFCAFRVQDALPSLARVAAYHGLVANQAASTLGQSAVSLKPTRPGPGAGAW